MKKLLLSFLLFFSIEGFSQIPSNYEILEKYLIEYFKNHKELNFNSIKNIMSLENNISMIENIQIEREYDFGLIERVFRIDLESFDLHLHKKVSAYSSNYYLHVYEEEGNVIMGILKTDKKENSIIAYNKNKFKKYIKKHDKFYKTKSSVDSFIKDVTTSHTYGYHCSIAPYLKEPLEYNNIKYVPSNINIFSSWLKSYNPELQTYGLDALTYLEKNHKLTIDKNNKIIIEQIKKRNSLISTCEGCLHSKRKIFNKNKSSINDIELGMKVKKVLKILKVDKRDLYLIQEPPLIYRAINIKKDSTYLSLAIERTSLAMTKIKEDKAIDFLLNKPIIGLAIKKVDGKTKIKGQTPVFWK